MLLVLPAWWALSGTAQATGPARAAGPVQAAGTTRAASYPPALDCAVSGLADTGSSMLQVSGVGFGAGSPVLVSVDGRRTGTTRADAAGSFQVSWPIGTLVPGAALAAATAGCSAVSALMVENDQDLSADSALSPADSGAAAGPPSPPPSGSARPSPAQPGVAPPVKQAKGRPAASATQVEPAPPARQTDPPAAAIPSIPLTGLPPQLFLGLVGAVLLAGVALTGLTGRLGHRGEHRPARAASAAGTQRIPARF